MSRRAGRAAVARISRRHGGAAPAAGRFTVLAVCGILVVLIALVFGQTVRHDFVNYDDDQYVVENPHVAPGVTTEGIRWAFTRSHASNWHPLTWLSHMADCQLYGVTAPGAHHLTSVALHAATAVLLFLVLLQITSNLWPSAFVSALFAIHPLHVESVAWVSERKDVLSGLFFVLTVAAYARYVRAPGAWRYTLVVATFALGLLSKPMLVSVPLVLLLLDYWPLGRLATAEATGASVKTVNPRRTVVSLVLEKVPLLALALVTSFVTYLVQDTARGSMSHLTVASRVANALVSYVTYLGQFLYPVRLSVFYPHPGNALPVWQVVGACVVLAVVSGAALAWRRQHPYMIVGWLWYLGMLVPVIGVVQVGYQARADRYTYLTQIGLYVMVAWGAAHVAGASPRRRRACGVAACAAIAVLASAASRQTSYWSSSETLWTHALDATPGNYQAHNHLARVLAARGDADGAIAHYRQALRLEPDFIEAHNNLGNVLASRGQLAEAVAHYRTALRIKPDYVEALNNLGLALAESGEIDAAIPQYRRALALDPEFADAHYNLGNALASKGQTGDAIGQYEKAVALRPDFAEVHNNLGTVLARQGQLDAAIAHYQKALAINPQFASARRNLAAVLAERKGS